MKAIEKVCIVCPIGCNLVIKKDIRAKDGYKVSGNQCPRGYDYAIKEMTNPERVLTSTVKIKGRDHYVLPVRTNLGIPKEKIFQIMDELKYLEIELPVEAGDVILENICDTKANLIATKSVS